MKIGLIIYNKIDFFNQRGIISSKLFLSYIWLIKIINDLRNYGFICSMDDFGKAYSSLNLLKDLPIDVLKLDSAFFEDSDNPDKVKLIIKDIIKMVNNLGIKTVAEGVEQVSQVEFLREVGCDLVQGYVYYKPMPINEYEKLIDKNS